MIVPVNINGVDEEIDVPDDATPEEIDALVNTEFGGMGGIGEAQGLSPRTKGLVKENLPWMADDVANTKYNPTAGAPQPQNYHPGRMKVGQEPQPFGAEPSEGAQMGAEVANVLPETMGAVGTAIGFAENPLLAPVGGMAGRVIGESGKNALLNLLGFKGVPITPSPNKLTSAGVTGAAEGALVGVDPAQVGKRGLNAVKYGAEKLGGMGKPLESALAKLMKTYPEAPQVGAAIRQKVNPTKSGVVGQVEKARNFAGEGIGGKPDELGGFVKIAEQSGQTMPRQQLIDDLVGIRNRITFARPGDPKIQAIDNFIKTEIGAFPEQIGAAQLQATKKSLGLDVSNWESSFAKDLAHSGSTAAKKTAYSSTKKGLDEMMIDPKAYQSLKQEYSDLATLLNPTKNPQIADISQEPIQIAATKMADKSGLGKAKTKAQYWTGRGSKAVENWGKTRPEGPSEFAINKEPWMEFVQPEVSSTPTMGPRMPQEPLALPAPTIGGMTPEQIQASQAIIEGRAWRTQSPTVYGTPTGENWSVMPTETMSPIPQSEFGVIPKGPIGQQSLQYPSPAGSPEYSTLKEQGPSQWLIEELLKKGKKIK